jgi:excisionase family DNA binding protein
MAQTAPHPPPQDWPVYWFAELERSIEVGDFVAAAKAQAELERLGVIVRYRPRPEKQEVLRGAPPTSSPRKSPGCCPTGRRWPMPSFYTPAQVAELLAVDQGKILAWLHSGELHGINIAKRAGGRPRWRISSEQLQAFLQSRSTSPPPKPAKRRRQQSGQVTAYY